MKIGCHCGATIIDQTDDLPHKGHLIPDMTYYRNLERIADEVLKPLAEGRIDQPDAAKRTYLTFGETSRLMWQCPDCGRLYIELPNSEKVCCFVPEGEVIEKAILRATPNVL